MALTKFFNEMTADDGSVRAHYASYAAWLNETPPDRIARKRAEADALFHRYGITFAVYGEESGTERLIPFDIIPRIIPAQEWKGLEAGLRQRVKALNAFIHDIYNEQEILKAGRIPAEQVLNNAQYRPEMKGVKVPCDIYAAIAGVDVVRAGAGEFYVLEDNLRVPSGVSYMLEDRRMMMRLFPDSSPATRSPVEHYPDMLLNTLRSLAPAGVSDPTVVVLTPGAYNSAYFEHAFLAQQMGVELVEGRISSCATIRSSCAPPRAVPRRCDLPPRRRRLPRSEVLPQGFHARRAGLLDAYRAGRVTLSNAIGTGVADDKSIYPYVPEMIRFYLGEEPILNNVPTYMCRKPEDLAYTLAHLPELVVKEVHGAGGYGMLVGPASTKEQIETFRRYLEANPEKYIAQPTLALSNCPTFVESGVAPRHLDLRPFVLSGREVQLVPGGLTRVALREGSLVVNSSQGGGTKDTWVLEA
jgi:uncharacterized circularly permuted ATP-grasp superfamily protein